MAENFPGLAKDIRLQIQEAEQTLNKINPKKLTPKCIIGKLPKTKDKEKVLKIERNYSLTHRTKTI